MTQVWVVQYDEGLYLFKDVPVAIQSIEDMYKAEGCTFESETISDVAYTVRVLNGDRVQDQISIIAFDVHEHPTVIHRYVTEIDTPTVNVDPRFVKGEEF